MLIFSPEPFFFPINSPNLKDSSFVRICDKKQYILPFKKLKPANV